MRNKDLNIDSFLDKEWSNKDQLDFVFNAKYYPNLKAYFDNNRLIEKCLYYILVEDLYDTIKIEIIIKKLALTTFQFADVKKFIISVSDRVNNFYGVKGFLKQSKIYYKEQMFIIPNAEPLENEYYQVRDLLDSIEKSLIYQ